MFKFEVRTARIISSYICLEMAVWLFLSVAAIYYGKIFDYTYAKTDEFVSHLSDEKDGNWYYRLMFGDLNLTNIDASQQESLQGKCDTLNTLFVFVFGSYFILSIFFMLGMTKMLGSKCLLCPYVTMDLCVLATVVVFVIYGSLKNIYQLNRNGSFFVLVKLFPSAIIFQYYNSLSE